MGYNGYHIKKQNVYSGGTIPGACSTYSARLVNMPPPRLYILKYYVAGIVPRNIYGTDGHNSSE